MAKPTITMPVAYLRECFSLDVGTGTLTWRERPLEHFSAERIQKAANKRHAGKRADKLKSEGPQYSRRGVKLTFQGNLFDLKAHRIVFALVHGRWPEKEVDHVNGDAADNRPENLREATHAENVQNKRHALRNNGSGMLGVHWHRHSRLWRARIDINGKNIMLGYFTSPGAAHTAYLEAKARLHPFAPPASSGS